MANPFYEQIPQLSQVLGDWNPMTYMMGGQALQQGNQYAQGAKQQQDLKTAYDAQNYPQLLQKQGLDNLGAMFELPGREADSRSRVVRADTDEATKQLNIESLHSKYKSQLKDDDYKQLSRAGEIYGQVGAQLPFLVPDPTQRGAVAKRLLGQYWHPEFEKMDPAKLHEKLQYASQAMQELMPKFQMKQMDIDSRESIADNRNATSMANTQARLAWDQQKQQLQNNFRSQLAAAAATKDPKNMESLAASYQKQANAAQEEDVKQQFQALADAALAAAYQFKVGVAQAGNPGKVDPAALGMDTLAVPPAPSARPANPSSPVIPNQERKPVNKLPNGKEVFEGDTVYDAQGRKYVIDGKGTPVLQQGK